MFTGCPQVCAQVEVEPSWSAAPDREGSPSPCRRGGARVGSATGSGGVRVRMAPDRGGHTVGIAGAGRRRRPETEVATLTSMEGYAAAAAVVLAGILLVTAAMVARRLIAPRAVTEKGLRTYESGVDPVGVGWAQSQIRYISFAFLYVVFAVDAVYLFPWALVIRDPDLGVASLVEVVVFVGVILVGLVHAGRRGLLRWTV